MSRLASSSSNFLGINTKTASRRCENHRRKILVLTQKIYISFFSSRGHQENTQPPNVDPNWDCRSKIWLAGWLPGTPLATLKSQGPGHVAGAPVVIT
jgi:hypothetical protein